MSLETLKKAKAQILKERDLEKKEREDKLNEFKRQIKELQEEVLDIKDLSKEQVTMLIEQYFDPQKIVECDDEAIPANGASRIDFHAKKNAYFSVFFVADELPLIKYLIYGQ